MAINLRDLPQIKDLNAEELKLFYSMVNQAKTTDNYSILDDLWSVDYDEVPVSIDEFLENDRYMGKVFNNGKSIYPFWREHLRKLFNENTDHSFEVAYSGAIGLGKSTIAVIAMLYHLYRVMCLKNPQSFYGLTASAPIVFVVLNLTLDLCYSGLYSMAVESIKLSPWFCERVEIRGKYNYTVEFPNNISIVCASTVQHVIGKNVIFALMDEINFSNSPKGSKRSVMDMYRNIRRRVESRFMRNGRVYGYIFLISSKNTEQDFLDTYIQSLKGSKSTIVIDEPIWNVKPPETYIGTRFKVAVGDKTKASYVIETEDDLRRAETTGYKIIDVPTEYKTAFQQDINDALKDIAGISSFSTNKLIPYAGRVEACIKKSRPSPLMINTIELSLDSPDEIRDYLDDLGILKVDTHIPRFAHIDIGLKNDALGLGICHAARQTLVERFDPNGAVTNVSENVYSVDLMLRIKALPGSEIPLYKVRGFLMWLNSYIFKIKKVTYDGFQSADSIQLLKVAGFDAALQSLDRSDEPYLNLRSCILENRLEMYYDENFVREIYDLEYDRKAKKVDHPAETVDNQPGSKDLADGVCGAVFACQKYYSEKKASTSVMQKRNVQNNMKAVEQLNKMRYASRYKDEDVSWI